MSGYHVVSAVDADWQGHGPTAQELLPATAGRARRLVRMEIGRTPDRTRWNEETD